jgi:hypothetical protein
MKETLAQAAHSRPSQAQQQKRKTKPEQLQV